MAIIQGRDDGGRSEVIKEVRFCVLQGTPMELAGSLEVAEKEKDESEVFSLGN